MASGDMLSTVLSNALRSREAGVKFSGKSRLPEALMRSPRYKRFSSKIEMSETGLSLDTTMASRVFASPAPTGVVIPEAATKHDSATHTLKKDRLVFIKSSMLLGGRCRCSVRNQGPAMRRTKSRYTAL